MSTTRDEERWAGGGLDQLRRFVELLPVGAAFVEGESLLVNAAVERLTGHRRGDLATVDAWFRTLYGDDAERVRRIYETDRAAGFPSPRTAELVRRDGARRLMEFRAREADGVVVWTLADVTEREAATHAAAESQARLEEAQRLGGIGSWSWDAASDTTTLSPELYRTLGVEPGQRGPGLEILGEIVHPDDRRAHREHFLGSLARGEPSGGGEYRLLRPDGEVRRVRLRGEWRYDEAGRPVSGFGVVQDVTAQRELEDQLRQAQKMEAVALMAGGVAHDFNNLLTVIVGAAQLILENEDAGDACHEEAQAIAQAARRGAELTRQLLTFSRRQVVHPRRVDVAALVRGAERMLRRMVGESTVLHTIVERGLQPVYVDPGQLEQVLVNLVVNAHDAMPEGGHVDIELSRAVLDESDVARHPDAAPGEYVVLSVSDEGTGMDEETQARIFDPFFTTKEKGRGTGLGLPTVFGIVRQAGGHLRVSSEPGAGSTFEVYLPRASDDAPKSGAIPPPASNAGGTETILLVEDEPLVRHLVRRALESRGYTVLEAGSGLEAVQLSNAHDAPIHLLLTDVVLPELNGREVAETLRQLRPGIRVLYMSGYPEDGQLRRLTSEGSAPFIAKPFTVAALAAAVRGVLDGMPS